LFDVVDGSGESDFSGTDGTIPAPERTRRLVEHDALEYVVVMAHGDTMPEIRRRLARVVKDTGTLYALAIQPYIATDGAGITHALRYGRTIEHRTDSRRDRTKPALAWLPRGRTPPLRVAAEPVTPTTDDRPVGC
jgi:hypothetical protein